MLSFPSHEVTAMQAAKSQLSLKMSTPHPPLRAVDGARRAQPERALRVVLHGVEGVGKSTFASLAPSPVFLCSEDGTAHLDVARFPTPTSLADVFECIRVLSYEQHTFKTLVIDTLDWLDPLIARHVCLMSGHAHVDDIPHGKGRQAMITQWRVLIGRLEMLIRLRNMHVVLLAHSSIRRLENEQGAFDRFQLKLGDKVADALHAWADMVLFARHEVVRVERHGIVRSVTTGARVAYTGNLSSCDAHNRFEMPSSLPLDWDDMVSATRAFCPDADALKAQLWELIPGLAESAKATDVMESWAGDDPKRLLQLLDRVRSKLALEGGGEGLEIPRLSAIQPEFARAYGHTGLSHKGHKAESISNWAGLF